MGEFVPRPKTLGGDIPCLDSPELARKRQKTLSARAELRAERLLRAEPNLETTVETQADGAPLFHISDLSAGYDKKVVVEGVDLKVRAGNVVALIGPNGSGKSTILKTITRHLAPLAGAVELAEDGGVCKEPCGYADRSPPDRAPHLPRCRRGGKAPLHRANGHTLTRRP